MNAQKILVQLPMFLIAVAIFTACSPPAKNAPTAVADTIEVYTAPSDVPLPAYGQLSIQGRFLMGEKGDTVQLRGMSLFWSQWIGKYYNREAIGWLVRDWRCNIVRAALAVEHDGYLARPQVEKAKVFAVVEAAIAEGIYVMVDWHDHHAEDHEAEARAFFSELAQRYGKYPNLIYEIYNEPLDVSWPEVLKPYSERVIAEIRKHDPDNIIICGTPNWSQRIGTVIGAPIAQPNIAYSVHFYAATHKQWLRDNTENALNAGIPVFITEYGTTEANGSGHIDHAEMRAWWDFMEKHKLSWCNWSVADKDELSAALKPGTSAKGGWTADDLTESGTMVREELRRRNPAPASE